jgi:purine-binding chemotaxis protein CheW
MSRLDKRAILRQRAEAISRPFTIKVQEHRILEVLEFGLEGEAYALETRYIKEVLDLEDVVELPSVPAFVMGIFNHRCGILSVIDLRVLFNLPSTQMEGTAKMIVLSSKDMEFALYADSIGMVKTIAESDVSRTIPSLCTFPQAYFKGLIEDRIVLLDGSAILSDKGLIVYETVD